MATGDKTDSLARFRALLPRWFGDFSNTPILNAVLAAYAYCISWVYTLIQYAALQTRIKTATDGWLDMIAADFFGGALARSVNQSDTSFRARIIAFLFRQRATRAGLIQVLLDITGRTPLVFEPQRPLDTGAYNFRYGYNIGGGYGSLMMPYEALVTAFRPMSPGIPLVAGYGVPSSGYSTPSRGEWASLGFIDGAVTDADIYAAIDGVKVAGTTVWTQISN